MRKSTCSFVILLLVSGAIAAPAATRPITKEALAEALKIGGLSSAELSDTIRATGVAFALSPSDEQELKAAGADAALLGAIRQSRVPAKVRGAGRPLVPVELLLKLYHGTPVTAAAAVKAHGVGFVLTPAIEAQLLEAGADKSLLGLVTLRRLAFEPPAPVAETSAESVPTPAPGAVPRPVAVDAATPAAPGFRGVRIDPAVQANKLVKRPDPEYPQLAHRARMSGQVLLEVLVGRDGRVRRVRSLRGDAVFIDAAIDAVKGYVYKPTYLDDQAIDIVTEVTIDFDLAKAALGMKN